MTNFGNRLELEIKGGWNNILEGIEVLCEEVVNTLNYNFPFMIVVAVIGFILGFIIAVATIER